MKNRHIYSVMASCIPAMLLMLLCGCGQPTTTASKEPPKLDFHKPRNFSLAVERIRKIHDLLVAESEVPKPISYTVVEVSHAHGDGVSHVHYKLLDKTNRHIAEDCDCGHDHEVDKHDHARDDHDHDGHDHGDEHGHKDPFETGPPQHTVVVDVFTELSDVVRWLPEIAADGDMLGDDWKQVKSISDEMTAQLESLAGADEPTVQHSSYKSKAESIGDKIGQLEALVKPNAAKIL